MTGILAVFCAVMGGLAVLYRKKYKNLYQTIDTMLEEVLSERKITQSALREGEKSALAGKMLRLQEKLDLEISHAQMEKEQVKSLISNMSHQLKTPLANVVMYEEILEAGVEEAETQREFQRRLKEQTRKLDWILQSLFKMVKLEQGVLSFEAENLGIKDTIRNAVSGVYEKAEKKGMEICTESFEDRYLYHNRPWTAEAIENILENAVKYSPENSKIRITLEGFEMYTRIGIQDQGMGIPKKEQSRIFHRFYRGKNAENFEGSGIGLYLTRLILEMEKGYITVESAQGKGSTFFLYLQNCKN